MANNRPSEHEVTNAISKLTVEETKKLVHQLGMKLSVLDDIGGKDLPKEHFVQKWLDMDPAASWIKLVSALKKIDQNSLAVEVESKYILRSLTDGHIHQVTILLCGDKYVGKSSLILKFKEEHQHPDPTVAFNLEVYKMIMEWKSNNMDVKKVINFKMWDAPGDQGSWPTTKYFKNAEGIMVVYDITNKKSFENVKMWVDSIRRNTGVPIVLVGNKTDLESERVVSKKEGKDCAEECGAEFFETSARNGECVEKPFKYLCSQVFEIVSRFSDLKLNH